MIEKIKRFLLGAVCVSMCFGAVACGGTGPAGKDPMGGGNTNPPATEPVKIEEPFDINNEEHINWYGRTYVDEGNGEHWFNHSASGFEVTFKGTELTAQFRATNYSGTWNPVLGVYVDGESEPKNATVISLTEQKTTIALAEGLTEGLHTVKVLKRSEGQASENSLIELTTDGDFYTPPEKPVRKLEFFGDSLTCGVGITATQQTGEGDSMSEDGTATYAGIAARFFNAQYNVFAGGGRGLYKSPYYADDETIYDLYKHVDFGNASEWDFSSYVPDAVVINLGTNDSNYVNINCRTEQEKSDFYDGYKARYEQFIKELHALYPDAHIVVVYNMAAGENSYLHRGFEEFIDGLAVSEGLPLTVLKFAAMQDDPGAIMLDHPGLITHQKCGDMLVEHLKEILGW